MTRCAALRRVTWVALAALGGCFSGEEPLPPHEALAKAAQRSDTILQEEGARSRDAVPLEPPETPPDPGTVSFWYYTHPLAGPFMASRERWAGNHSPPTVLETQFIGEWNYAIEKLTVSLAAGDLPDMAMVKRGWLARLVASGRIVPLDTVLLPSLIDDIRVPSREAFVVGGRLYALPADGFCSVLYYNRTLVKEAPKDWEGLRRLARDVKRAGGGTANAAYPLGDLPFLEMLWSVGGTVCDEKKSGLASPEAFEALDFILSLRDEGLIHPHALGAPDSAFELFIAGKVAMTVASSQYTARARSAPFPVGMAPPPGKSGPVAMLSDNAIVVFARYAAAKRLEIGAVADFLTGPEVQGAEAADLGSVPTRASVARDVPSAEGLAQAYDHARNTPLVGPWSEIEFELMRYLNLAFQYKPKIP